MYCSTSSIYISSISLPCVLVHTTHFQRKLHNNNYYNINLISTFWITASSYLCIKLSEISIYTRINKNQYTLSRFRTSSRHQYSCPYVSFVCGFSQKFRSLKALLYLYGLVDQTIQSRLNLQFILSSFPKQRA